MTVSSTSDFSVTGGQLVKDSLSLLGVIDANGTVDSTSSEYCLRALNMLVKLLAISANLWVTEDVTHTLVPGTESYTVGSGLAIDTLRPLKLDTSRREDSSGVQIPVEVVSRQEYMDQPTKSTQSAALMTYYDPQRDNGVLYVWPTGTATEKTLILTFKRPIRDFDSNEDNPDFPQEWYMALVYLLSVKIAPTFIGRIPKDIKLESEQLFLALKNYDNETTSLIFQPNVR